MIGRCYLDNKRDSYRVPIIADSFSGRAFFLTEITVVMRLLTELRSETEMYAVHFRTNNLGKGMNPLIFQAMGEIVSLLSFVIESDMI